MSDAHRLKRLRLRSWRRGTKEMDLLLGTYADARLAQMSDTEIAVFESLLEENDHELYAWVTGRVPPPARLAGVIEDIGRCASEKFAQQSDVL